MTFRVKRVDQIRRHRGKVFAGVSAQPIRTVFPYCPPSKGFITLMQALASGQGAADSMHDDLPVAVLEDAAAYFGVSARRLRTVVRVPTTIADIVIDRNAMLDASVSKRLWRLANVALIAADVFEDEEAAKVWLRTQNRSFPAPAPLDFLATEAGTAAVCAVLNAVSTGGAA